MTYKTPQFDDLNNVQPNAIIKIESENPRRVTWINLDKDSSQKEEYLAWVAEGNTPLPADSE